MWKVPKMVGRSATAAMRDADVVATDAVAFVVGRGGDELVIGEVPDARLLVRVHRR